MLDRLPPQLQAFLVDMGPALALLGAGIAAGSAWRWFRQRPLRAYSPAQLQSAFRFNADLRERYERRGSMSYRELHSTIRAAQRLIRAELWRRR